MVIESISSSNVAYNGTDALRKSARQVENVQITTTDTQVSQQQQVAATTSADNNSQGGQPGSDNGQNGNKKMSQKFVSEAIDNANSHLPTRTRCEFAYDETTKRVSITIRDKDTDEIIKEIPPKETLEMIAKMWELAGILVDEKR